VRSALDIWKHGAVKGSFRGLGASASGFDLATWSEALSYREIVPRLIVNTPEIFHLGIDSVNGHAVILMEDLALSGASFLKEGPTLDFGQASAFVDAMAGFHAQTWESKAFLPGAEWGPSSEIGVSRSRLYAEFVDGLVKPQWWNEYLSLPRATALPRKLVDQRRIEAAWTRLYSVMRACPRVIVHGDEHLGNLYLQSDGSPGFLDWYGRVEHWALSYTYFLCNTLDALDRRNWERPSWFAICVDSFRSGRRRRRSISTTTPTPCSAFEPMTTPITVEEITAPWLTSALSPRFPGLRISSVNIEDIMWGMSAKVRVRPTYAGTSQFADLPRTLIVKGHLGAHELGNSFSYELEMRSYRDVLPTLDVNSPVCYFAGDGAGGPILILEDLVTKNVRFLDAMQPLDYDQAVSFLDAQARIHARYWNSAEIDAGGRFEWISDTSEANIQLNAYVTACAEPSLWNAVSALPRAAAIPWKMRDRPRVERALQQLRSFQKSVPGCLVHGDEHLGNFYLESDGRPGFLDWQARKSQWCTSVAYFLVLGLDILDRRDWERSLLIRYLKTLSECGVDAPSIDAAWQAYRYSVLFPLIAWYPNSPTFQPEPLCAANASRAAWAVFDHGTLEMLNSGV
jgi:aminoglycoside/choline kinase family phosphotransferase